MREQQTAHRHRLRHGDEDGGLGVGENAGVAAHMLFNLRPAGRRIHRHRHPACEENAEIGVEIFGSGRQHQRHRLPAQQPLVLQASRDGGCARMQHRVGDRRFARFRQKNNLGAIRMRAQVPVKHLLQGGGRQRPGRFLCVLCAAFFSGCLCGCCGGGQRCSACAQRGSARHRAGAAQCMQQIARRCRLL